MISLFKTRKLGQMGIWDRVLSAVGLGGLRPIYTKGDLWWCTGLAYASGFLIGVALVAGLTRY